MTTPDPASGMEMDPEFVRLCEIVEFDETRMRSDHWEDRDDPATGRGLLWRWHVAAVEREARAAYLAATGGDDHGFEEHYNARNA